MVVSVAALSPLTFRYTGRSKNRHKWHFTSALSVSALFKLNQETGKLSPFSKLIDYQFIMQLEGEMIEIF
jgi:hypothetical protein